MIRIRALVERGLRDRWLAPLLLLLLALVLVGVAMHEGGEVTFGHGVEVCMALALALGGLLLLRRPPAIHSRGPAAGGRRAPPPRPARPIVALPGASQLHLPLRL